MEYFGVVTGLLYLFLEIKQHRAMWVIGFLTSFVYVFVFFSSKIYADMGLNLYYVLISIYGFWQWTRQRKTPSPSINEQATDSKTEIAIETGTNARRGAKTETEIKAGIKPQAETEIKAGPETKARPETEAGPETKAGRTETSGNADALLYREITWRLAAGIGLALTMFYGLLYFILTRYTDSPIPAGDAFTTAVGIVATWMLARRIIEHWLLWIVVNFVSVYLYYLRGLYPTMFLYLCYAVLAAVGLYNWKKKGIKTNDSTL